MSAKRVLFLGITGVDKGQALNRLNAHCQKQHGHGWTIVEFEKEFLWPRGDAKAQRESYLDSDLEDQHQDWVHAWGRFLEEYPTESAEPIFLSLHGLSIRGTYGARCAVDINRVANEFRPDIIVTLISDIYDMWWRTEERAEGMTFYGRPSLEHLIFGRRGELIIGDQIRLACDRPVRNFMISTNHPCATLANLLNHPDDATIIYLSFPISQPRELEFKGDLTARRSVSEFLKQAYTKQLANPRLVLQCPLGIDEIPFALCLPQEDTKKGQPFVFDRDSRRWNVDEFWDPEKSLVLGIRQGTEFVWKQLSDACGNIMTDVTWRDYRLVDQADKLLVFNPIFNNRDEMAGSVRVEIDHATHQRKPVFMYQDPQMDTSDRVGTQIGVPKTGHKATMGPTTMQTYITWRQSIEEFLHTLDEGSSH